MRRSLKKGSFTIEAACVMSLVLLAVMGMLYLFFFVHNRAWLTAAAYEAALSGSMEGVKDGGKVYETARMKGQELGNVGFFGAENMRMNLEAGKKVSVSYALDTIVPYGGFQMHMKAEGSSAVIRPVSWIRRVKAAFDTFGEIGG